MKTTAPAQDRAAKTTTSAKPAVPEQTRVPPLAALSRMLGNRRTGALIQAKVGIGPSDDVHEREAEAVADRVVQRSQDASASATSTPNDVPAHASTGARPLPPGLQHEMETGIDADFGRVRIHTDEGANALSRAIRARAFTLGTDIYFKQGEFDPTSLAGRRLLAHELTHVVQQTGAHETHSTARKHHATPNGRASVGPRDAAIAHPVTRVSGLPRIQRNGDPAADTAEPTEESLPEDEPRIHRWLNYDDAIRKNQLWFELLRLQGVNPFAPYDPYITPNAFVHRVLRWQGAADRSHFGELIFAAEQAQRQVRQGTLGSVAAGLDEILARISAREQVEPGKRVRPDGVLGPRTFWLMLVAGALTTTPEGRALLRRMRIPTDALAPLANDRSDAWGEAWRAVHAQVFNPAVVRASWTALVQADAVFRIYEQRFGYSDDNRRYLNEQFFPEGLADDIAVEDEDLTAILSRGYEGEAIEGIVSVLEVDRTYFGPLDIRQLVRTRQPEWTDLTVVSMATAEPDLAAHMLAEFGLGAPSGPQAQAALGRLMGQTDENVRSAGPIAVLVAVFRRPDRPEGFWPATAARYLEERELLERAANEATEEFLRDLEADFERRMAGRPDIGSSSDDALAFLELLVGPAFTRAQRARMDQHTEEARGYDVEISPRYHRARQASRVSTLFARARDNHFLVVQLGSNREERFPLAFRQIEQSRSQADTNGASPLIFDLIDTPQAAFHQFTPDRFSARPAAGGGSEIGKLGTSRLREEGRSWEVWRHASKRVYSQLEPALVEIREFNPDAGKFVQWYRQIVGTDRITVRFIWTLGGALVPLTDGLWSGQTRVNIVGWIDAVLTTVALASVVAAPLGAGVAGGGAAVTQGARAVGMTAARRALLGAVRRFAVTEAIAESLGRITYHINDSETVPDDLKKVWNGLMIALLIFGVTATVRYGIRAFRNRASVALRAEIEALEAALEAEARNVRPQTSAAETAAQAEVRQRTAERHRELVESELGGTPGTGASRVRTTDPRAADVAVEPAAQRVLTPELEGRIRQVLGNDAADALAASASEATRRRLALIADDDAIRKLHQALPDDQLAPALARLDTQTVARLAAAFDVPRLQTMLPALMASPRGVRLLRVFSSNAHLLAQLFDILGSRTLLALAEAPGPDRLLRLAERVHPDAILEALRTIGPNRATSLARFRQMVEEIGPELTADVLNTYRGAEIRSRWRRGSRQFAGLSPAQNIGRLAIQRGRRPTAARQRSPVPTPAAPTRPQTFGARDIPSFYAIGPEATAPAIVRENVVRLRHATAWAANQLETLMSRAAQGILTPAEIQALPPGARRTIEAFLRTGPTDANHHALYGSALQYLAEARLAQMFGGSLPPGMAIRRREVRHGRTLIPDAQVEITLSTELRFPNRNTVERAVIDWTTAGEAGKIAKYRGGTPPVTYAVELIQPGPPRPVPAAAPPPAPVPAGP